MVGNGRSGWYYQVAREGVVQAGDAVRCVARPNPAWTIARFAAGASRRSSGIPQRTVQPTGGKVT